jgi:rubrerythrin
LKRSFASLSTREVLRVAIAIEERNAHIYHRLGEILARSCPGSLQVSSAFYELADTERKHGALLVRRYSERFGPVLADIAEEDIEYLVEMPQLDVANILAAVEAGDVWRARRLALEIVRAAECNAVKYYSRLVETTSDPELNALYRELLAFEQEHNDWLEHALGQEPQSPTFLPSIPRAL